MTDEPVEATALGEDLGLRESEGPRRSHRRERRSYVGCLVALVLLGLVGGIVWLGLTRGVEWAQDFFADPEDYSGPGTGSVLIEVHSGDTATDIAHTLEDKNVVASAEAFIDEASGRSDEASRIQAGFYELKKEMSAEDAFDILADPANLVTAAVVVPEGLRVVDVVGILVRETKFKRAEFEKVLDSPRQLGLPAYAEGNPEGYLFPATYAFSPRDTPTTMLRQMVDRWKLAADSAGLEEAVGDLDYTPAELMVIASLVEAEARGDVEDRAKVARVIYNRLENPGTAGTIGRLEIDAAVNYGLGRKLGVTLTAEQKAVDTPYNTYLHAGLPPTPIEAPGDASIEAALHPAEGDWYYYVTVNLRTGETKFAETYEEFLGYKAEYTQYCQSSDAC